MHKHRAGGALREAAPPSARTRCFASAPAASSSPPSFPLLAARQRRRWYDTEGKSVRRLRMTTIITNIRHEDDAGEERPLTDYRIPKRYTRSHLTPAAPDGEPGAAVGDRTPALALQHHPEAARYPRRLAGGLKRWLYRLARKAVPEKANVPATTFRMETLHRQSGTTRPQRNFAIDIRKIAETQHLPEYSLRIDRDGKHELVSLFRDPAKPGRFPRGFRLSVINQLP